MSGTHSRHGKTGARLAVAICLAAAASAILSACVATSSSAPAVITLEAPTPSATDGWPSQFASTCSPNCTPIAFQRAGNVGVVLFASGGQPGNSGILFAEWVRFQGHWVRTGLQFGISAELTRKDPLWAGVGRRVGAEPTVQAIGGFVSNNVHSIVIALGSLSGSVSDVLHPPLHGNYFTVLVGPISHQERASVIALDRTGHVLASRTCLLLQSSLATNVVLDWHRSGYGIATCDW